MLPPASAHSHHPLPVKAGPTCLRTCMHACIPWRFVVSRAFVRSLVLCCWAVPAAGDVQVGKDLPAASATPSFIFRTMASAAAAGQPGSRPLPLPLPPPRHRSGQPGGQCHRAAPSLALLGCAPSMLSLPRSLPQVRPGKVSCSRPSAANPLVLAESALGSRITDPASREHLFVSDNAVFRKDVTAGRVVATTVVAGVDGAAAANVTRPGLVGANLEVVNMTVMGTNNRSEWKREGGQAGGWGGGAGRVGRGQPWAGGWWEPAWRSPHDRDGHQQQE